MRPVDENELRGPADLRRLTNEAGRNGTSFPNASPFYSHGHRKNVCCSFWACFHMHCTPCPFLIVSTFPLSLSFCGFPFCLWNLCPCVSISSIQAPPSLEGLFPQNERSLIKISTLETEAKGATTQKSNFRQKQKSHEVLANTAFQLTTVRVNISCGSPPKEATPSVEGLI